MSEYEIHVKSVKGVVNIIPPIFIHSVVILRWKSILSKKLSNQTKINPIESFLNDNQPSKVQRTRLLSLWEYHCPAIFGPKWRFSLVLIWWRRILLNYRYKNSSFRRLFWLFITWRWWKIVARNFRITIPIFCILK